MWMMSYEQARRINPEATNILDQWAFLHHGDVSYELIRTYPEMSKRDQEEGGIEDMLDFATDEPAFQDSLGVLAQYFLVNAIDGSAGFSIHPVMHRWTLHRIVDNKAREALCARAIRIVARRVPLVSGTGQQIRAEGLLPHARVVATRLEKETGVTGVDYDLYVMAHFVARCERSQTAEFLYLRALTESEEAWGPEKEMTLGICSNLGLLYRNQDKLQKAKDVWLRTLVGMEKKLGPENATTLQTLDSLGALYGRQGKLKDAEDMYLRALRGKEKALGQSHDSTLRAAWNLSLL